MKLLSLKIQGYKNLKDTGKVSIDFSGCTNYTALIGLNGSGKSNVLEAVSLIFSSLYHNTKLEDDFQYDLIYEIDNVKVQVSNGAMTVEQPNAKGVITVGKKSHKNYLPTNVIASYSGEELRMWDNIYFKSYSEFFKNIKNNAESASPRLLYLNKYAWEFSLITLLCSESDIVKKFITDVLQITALDVKVTFTFNDIENSKNYPDNDVIIFVRELIEAQTKNGGQLTITQIQNINFSVFKSLDVLKEMFFSLFITSMPVRNTNAKIYVQKLINSIELKFNDIDVRKLSEGEKKLILIYTITHLLADNKTLILLDEPDAHIHIERKKDIIDIIDKEDCFTLFTTHSPKILNCINENNIKLIKNTKETGVEVLKLDRINALSEITNGEFSIIDATLALSTSKDILLVEGTNDYNYIMQAIEKLSPDYDAYDFHIINCGGADNVPAVVEQSLLSILKDSQLCLCTFDYDSQGRRNYEKIIEIATKEDKTNLKAMYHTKLDGTDHVNNEDFYMEDYFPVDAYKTDIINAINGKTSFKQLEEYQKPKSIIQNKYKTFDVSKYEKFKMLLDETLKIKNDFHSSPD
ncbi:AAA family ATPase [Tenacibaculum sp. XPcli2-G]|uniref:ATP-dependent nuclease n=1 Tax=Tenacibaculum sp. XPcli2-G TaxID=2954503 RepID=UPI002097E5DB|nr:AAA family ATPase [Tenacibaculum sp. XPcli2-G]MCO7185047.1 AAA family ATPase [Tenacibaculum sp. XPcli2-G]